MNKTYQQDIVNELVKDILKHGFRVFISKSGTYGFYTDDKCSYPVSFRCEFGSIKFSGNYTSSKSGTGWRLEDNKTYSQMFDTYPPNWITNYDKVKLVSANEYLKCYQKSSLFKEVK